MEVEVFGPGSTGTGSNDKNCFTVKTVRNNPAASGVVTGHQTYSSFLSSLLCELLNDVFTWTSTLAFPGSKGRGAGVHLC